MRDRKTEIGQTVGKVTYIHGAAPLPPKPTHEDVETAIRLVDQVVRENPKGYLAYMRSLGISREQIEADWDRWRAIDAGRAVEAHIQSMAQQHRPTLDQLEAAERDISQHAYEFPPDGLRVRPDEPSMSMYGGPVDGSMHAHGSRTPIYFDEHQKPQVDLYFGISDPRSGPWSDVAELDIWAPDQNPAPHQLPPVDFHAIVMAGLIVLIMTCLGVGILNLFPTTTFAEFLAALPIPR